MKKGVLFFFQKKPFLFPSSYSSLYLGITHPLSHPLCQDGGPTQPISLGLIIFALMDVIPTTTFVGYFSLSINNPLRIYQTL